MLFIFKHTIYGVVTFTIVLEILQLIPLISVGIHAKKLSKKVLLMFKLVCEFIALTNHKLFGDKSDLVLHSLLHYYCPLKMKHCCSKKKNVCNLSLSVATQSHW